MKLSYRAKHFIRLAILLSLLGGIIVFIYINIVNDQHMTLRKLQNIDFTENKQKQFINSVDESGGHKIQQLAVEGALQNNQQITINEVATIHDLV